MPSYVYVFNPEGKMPGIMGPYSAFEAKRVSDKLEVRNVVVPVLSHNRRRAIGEVKRKVIEEYGYGKGSKRVSHLHPVAQEND